MTSSSPTDRTGAGGAACGAQAAVQHDGRATVATCTDHRLGHYDPQLNLSWPVGDGELLRERDAR